MISKRFYLYSLFLQVMCLTLEALLVGLFSVFFLLANTICSTLPVVIIDRPVCEFLCFFPSARAQGLPRSSVLCV